MTSAIQPMIFEGLRILFILGLPLVVVAALSGLVVGVFQAATTIRDPAIGYAVRLLAVLALLYALVPLISETMQRFAQAALSGAI